MKQKRYNISIRAICLFTLFIHLGPSILGQNYSISQFSEKSNFGSNTVYNICQDHEGYLWIGTEVGLLRYDGSEFLEYGISSGLADLEVFDITIDSSNHIVLHNFTNKLNYYYKGNFYSSESEGTLPNLNYHEIPIAEYYRSHDALLLSQQEGSNFYYLKLKHGQADFVQKIALDSSRRIDAFVNLSDYYYVFHSDSIKYDSYDVYAGTHRIKRYKLPSYAGGGAPVAHSSYICMVQSNSLNRVHFFSQLPDLSLTLRHSIDIEGSIKNILSTKNRLWCTTLEGGIYEIDTSGVLNFYLPDKAVNNVFVDAYDNVWIGTADDGLFQFRSHSITNLDQEDFVHSNGVMSIIDNPVSEEIYVGLNKHAIASIRNRTVSRVYSLDSSDTPVSRRVRKLLAWKNDTLICGTDDIFAKITLDKKNSAVQFHETHGRNVKDLAILQQKVYISSSSGLEYLKKGTINPILDLRTITIHVDEYNTLWISTIHGLYYKLPNENIINQCLLPELDHVRINDIISDRQTLFLATDIGVYLIHNDDHRVVKHFTETTGLLSNQSNALYFSDSTLWIGTAKGVSILELSETNTSVKEAYSIDMSDGLASNYINDLLVRDDTVYVATNEGLSIFDKDLIFESQRTKTKIIKAKTNRRDINIYRPIELEPEEEVLSISFSNMTFNNSTQNSFEYKLNPIHDTWSTINENTITFSDLEPGTYTFQVRHENSDTEFLHKPVELDFTVKPRFAQTILFKLSLVLLSVFALVFLLYRRELAIKKEHYFNKTSTLLELEAIKAQINPHFIYNCLNSIKNTIIKKENIQAEKQLSIFAKLVRQTLNISKHNFLSLHNEIEYLTKYLEMEKMRFKDKMNFNITLKYINNPMNQDIPSMLIQPFVENAVKHGIPKEGIQIPKINIVFTRKSDRLICTISDNGPGFDQSQAKNSAFHESMGRKISSSRAEMYNRLYNTDINISTLSSNKGTTVIINLPANIDFDGRN